MSRLVEIQSEKRFKRNAKALLRVFRSYFDELPSKKRVNMAGLNLADTYMIGLEEEEMVILFIYNSSSHWETLKAQNDKDLARSILNLAPARMQKSLTSYRDAIID